MSATPHRRTRKLIGRYLDARRSWDAPRDRQLREHLRDCDDCSSVYDRAVVAHRLMVSGEADEPTGFERSRAQAAILGESPFRQRPRPGTWLGLAGAAAAAALLVALALPSSRLGDDEYFAPRGPDGTPVLVGLDVTGVTGRAGDEYEVIASGAAFRDDFLRFAYSNERDDLGHLFVFGLQRGQEPIWYAPLPSERTSLAIGQGRLVVLRSGQRQPFEVGLAEPHVLGRLRLVAIFSRAALELDAVEAALAALGDGGMELPAEAFALMLGRSLSLAPTDVIRILDTSVHPGSREEDRIDAP